MLSQGLLLLACACVAISFAGLVDLSNALVGAHHRSASTLLGLCSLLDLETLSQGLLLLACAGVAISFVGLVDLSNACSSAASLVLWGGPKPF